jgi:hypothetical protein
MLIWKRLWQVLENAQPVYAESPGVASAHPSRGNEVNEERSTFNLPNSDFFSGGASGAVSQFDFRET